MNGKELETMELKMIKIEQWKEIEEKVIKMK